MTLSTIEIHIKNQIIPFEIARDLSTDKILHNLNNIWFITWYGFIL
jgi:hypothetical protein